MEKSPTLVLDDSHDSLKMRNDSQVKKKLGLDEKVLFSATVQKINKRRKKQERTLLITTRALYNIDNSGFLTNLFSSPIKRKIDLDKIAAITISELSNEFIIHIPSEYDYRYSSNDKRDLIVQVITKAFYDLISGRNLVFHFKDMFELTPFTTTEDDMKKGISRIPREGGAELSEEGIQRALNDLKERKAELNAKTEKVFSKESSNLQKVTLDDFNLLKVLGRGAFGKVMLVEKKDTKQVYALKSLRKVDLIDKDQVEHTKTEKYVLEKSNCPFLVSLEYAFQTPEKIFFVMRFMKGGEMFQHLRISRRFEEKRAKFYAAEIVLAIEYLHSMNVLYRDLKPENILLDEDGHVCLTDFGMAKLLKEGEKANSFVGTPEYLAPEIIDQVGHSKPADWWSIGILIYEMIIGIPPFYNKEQNQAIMFKNIREKDINFGTKVSVSDDMKDIVKKLLIKDPKRRLGTKGADEIKSHPWFAEIDWKALNEKKVTPPFKPNVTSDYDTDNFDEEFTSEEAINSVIPNSNMKLIKKHAADFKYFGQELQRLINTTSYLTIAAFMPRK